MRVTPSRPLIVGLVVALLVGIGLADAGSTPATTSASVSSPVVAPAASQSSASYCVGGAPAGASWRLVVTDTTPRAASGVVVLTDGQGHTGRAPLSVPARGTVVFDPARAGPAPWSAGTVSVASGGVVVASGLQQGSSWSLVPCATAVSPSWYLPAGSTAGGDTLETVVYNPAATPAVVNLSFVTGNGVVQPQPFQGLVLAPGGAVSEHAETLVQDDPSVGTIVTAASGRVVAGEVWSAAGPASTLVAGADRTGSRWVVPSSTDTPGGATTLSVLDPTGNPARVTVRVQLPSGPVAPLTDEVPGFGAWQLVLSRQTRIPASEPYTTTVTAQGAPVVVARGTRAPLGASVPALGVLPALPAPAGAAEDATEWVVPAPGAPSGPLVGGASTRAVAIADPGSRAVSATVEVLGGNGWQPGARGAGLHVPAGGLVEYEPGPGAPSTYRVTSSGPVAVTADLVPAGAPGTVSAPGVPARG